MNSSILHRFHLMFGNHTNWYCHAVIVGNFKCEKIEEAVSNCQINSNKHKTIIQRNKLNLTWHIYWNWAEHTRKHGSCNTNSNWEAILKYNQDFKNTSANQFKKSGERHKNRNERENMYTNKPKWSHKEM